MKTLYALTAAVFALAAAGAAAQTYRQPTRFEQAKAYCEMMADATTRGAEPGPIDGRTAATTGVTAGLGLLAIGASLAAHAANYDRCMVGLGYQRQN